MIQYQRQREILSMLEAEQAISIRAAGKGSVRQRVDRPP